MAPRIGTCLPLNYNQYQQSTPQGADQCFCGSMTLFFSSFMQGYQNIPSDTSSTSTPLNERSLSQTSDGSATSEIAIDALSLDEPPLREASSFEEGFVTLLDRSNQFLLLTNGETESTVESRAAAEPEPIEEELSIVKMSTHGVKVLNGDLNNLLKTKHLEIEAIISGMVYNVREIPNRQGTSLKGVGAFGRVLTGINSLGQPVALKLLSAPFNNRSMRLKQRNEALMQLRLNGISNHLVGAQAAGEWCGVTFIAMERVQGDDLFNFAEHLDVNRKNQEMILGCVLGAACGIEAMHENQIVHGDLKLENILYDFQQRMGKIIDFGFSFTLPDGYESKVMPKLSGTPGFIAPEMPEQNIQGKKSDVFAFGVCMYMAFTRENIPGDDDALVPSPVNITWGHLKLHCGHNIGELIRECLSFHPDDRPSMTEVRQRLGQCARKEHYFNFLT